MTRVPILLLLDDGIETKWKCLEELRYDVMELQHHH